MQHLQSLADLLEGYFDMPAVIEPNRAEGSRHIRLLPGELALKDTGQAGEQTDIPYTVELKVTVSFRLTGGNEKLSLTNQGVALAVQIAEFFRSEQLDLPGGTEQLAPGLKFEGTAIFDRFKKLQDQSGFAGLSDENGKENKLFLYREDWTLRLRLLVLREHQPPTLQHVTFTDTGGNEITRVGS